jgi:hypothetical protein
MPTQRPISKDEERAAQPNLPPAGDERREQLARNADALAEQQDALGQTTVTVDPAKLKEDREILRYIVNDTFNQLDVENAQPGYRYCWCPDYDQQIRAKQALTVKEIPSQRTIPVWDIVRGDMPESPSLKDVRTFRKLGDTILMRARDEIVQALDRYERELNEAAAGIPQHVDALIEETARRTGRQSITPHVMVGTSPREYFKQRSELVRGVRSGPIGTAALKSGTVPGFRVGR